MNSCFFLLYKLLIIKVKAALDFYDLKCSQGLGFWI